MQVTGTCFTPTTAVRFGGIEASSVTFVDESTLRVQVPPLPMQPTLAPCGALYFPVDVTVSDGGETSTLELGYVYVFVVRPARLCSWIQFKTL